MDPALIPTFSALAGTVIGGVTSFATSWVTTTAKERAARLAAERSKREELYGRFMEELATLYAGALSSTTVDYGKLTGAFALRGRITLTGSEPVVQAADRALKFIVDVAMGPPRDAAEVRRMMDDRSADTITAFARASREELQGLRAA
jgi:hypothetical protein